MFQRYSLGLEDGQRALTAAIEEATKDGRPMAMAVVDDTGALICCARMDGAPERVLRFAIRKAYTAAVMRRDTVGFKKELADRGRSLADYGDPLFTTLQGGMPVTVDGKFVGAVAVGGNTADRDEGIARIAAEAIAKGAAV